MYVVHMSHYCLRHMLAICIRIKTKALLIMASSYPGNAAILLHRRRDFVRSFVDDQRHTCKDYPICFR